ncbi:MAG: Hpt domain-containing protein [Aestuariibaculum sp.]
MPQIQPNLDYIKKIAHGNIEVEAKLISIVKNEFPKEKKEFTKYLNENNCKKASAIVHKLKHKFVVLGIETEYELINTFEKQLYNNNMTLHYKFKDMLLQLEIFIDTL